MKEPGTNKNFEYLLNQAVEDAKSFKGWDFSYLDDSGRMVEPPHRWNYTDEVRPYLSGVKTLLDIGTGGGEIMSRFQTFPESSYAAEDYPPNVILAKERLEPLGVKVVAIEQEFEPPWMANLPFEDDYFDLVVNRHTGYTASEIYKILKPGGYYITQQVGGLTGINLKFIILGTESFRVPNWNLKVATDELSSCGFELVEEMEEVTYSRFSDIGAIVYYLIAIPWFIEDFTAEGYRDKLFYLHNYIERHGFFDMVFERLFVIGQKPQHSKK